MIDAEIPEYIGFIQDARWAKIAPPDYLKMDPIWREWIRSTRLIEMYAENERRALGG